jgi:hypothetical protein
MLLKIHLIFLLYKFISLNRFLKKISILFLILTKYIENICKVNFKL